MIITIQKQKQHPVYRFISGFVAFTFIFTMIMPPTNLYAQSAPTVLNQPAGLITGLAGLLVPGTMVAPSAGFTPPMVNGITVYPDDPFRFNFIVGRGDHDLQDEAFEAEAKKLINYFLASLTVPEDELWVNLSPYEGDRIIPDRLSRTEMGRDMLAQDYMLKQLTASLMYPENELGQRFWDRIHKKVSEEYGVSDIPVDTFNKVWIVPQKASIYETKNTAIVFDSYLKVMLESDYEALENNKTIGTNDGDDPTGLSKQIIREVIIPEIEKEVNEGETFANLRQIYNSMILATWYKKNLKESLLGQVYVDQNKVKGIDTVESDVKDKVYAQYLEAFNVGVYNYIKEDYDPRSGAVVPRKYFAGGLTKVDPANIDSFAEQVVGTLPTVVDQTMNDENIVVAFTKTDGTPLSVPGRPAVELAAAASPAVTPPSDVHGSFIRGNLAHTFRYTREQNGNIRFITNDPVGVDGIETTNMYYNKGSDQTTTNEEESVDGNVIPKAVRAYIDFQGYFLKAQDRSALEAALAAGPATGASASPVVHTNIGVLAQRITRAAKANTGELNGKAAVRAGANGAISGHSETRQNLGDTDEDVADQLLFQHELGLDQKIMAFGEPLEVREAEGHAAYVDNQLIVGTEKINAEQAADTIFAYEPIWAIGTGRTAAPEQAQAMLQHVRIEIERIFGEETAHKARLIYGGSVTPENAAELIAQPDIDGFLVGGASNTLDSILKIIRIAAEHGPTDGRVPYVGGNNKTKVIATGFYEDVQQALSAEGLDNRERVEVGFAPSVGLIGEAANAFRAASPVVDTIKNAAEQAGLDEKFSDVRPEILANLREEGIVIELVDTPIAETTGTLIRVKGFSTRYADGHVVIYVEVDNTPLGADAKGRDFAEAFDRYDLSEVDNARQSASASPVAQRVAQEGQMSSEDIKILGQRVTTEHGAFTGEVPIEDTIEEGATGLIAGHSEPRANFVRESNESINAQMRAGHEHALDMNMLAVGETVQEKTEGKSKEVVRADLYAGLEGLTAEQVGKSSVAYEPRWAIKGSGYGKPATAADAQDMAAYIRELIREKYGDEAARSIRILYGGSVSGDNAEEYLSQPDVDGLLVGGKSTFVEDFKPILDAAQKIGPTDGRKVLIGGNWKTYGIKSSYAEFAQLFSQYDPALMEIAVAPSLTKIGRLKSDLRANMPMRKETLLNAGIKEQTEFGDRNVAAARERGKPLVDILKEVAGSQEAAIARDVIISNEDVPLPAIETKDGEVKEPLREGHVVRNTSHDTNVYATRLKKGRVVQNISVVLDTSDIDRSQLEADIRKEVLRKLGGKYVFDSSITPMESTRETDRLLGGNGEVVIHSLNIDVLGSVKRTIVEMKLVYNESTEKESAWSPPVPLATTRNVGFELSKVQAPDFSHRTRPVKVALQGFGEIDTRVLRQMLLGKNSNMVRVVAITGNTALEAKKKILDDSLYGSWLSERDVRVVTEGGYEYIEIFVPGKNETHKIAFISDRSIQTRDLPWEELEVDIVVEGIKGKTKDEMLENIEASADMAILTAPSKTGPDGGKAKAVVVGTITAGDLDLALKDQACSGLSCTTGSVAAIFRHIMGYDVVEKFERIRARAMRYLTGKEKDPSLIKPYEVAASNLFTIHAATRSNELADATRGPSVIFGEGIFGSTGAAKALGEIFPSLKKNLNAEAMRVGVPTGSITSIHKILKVKRGDEVTVESLIERLRKEANGPDGKGIFDVSDDAFNSAQIVGRSESTIVLTSGIKVQKLDKGTFLVSYLAWYDNVNGYAARINDAVQVFADELYYRAKEANNVEELLRKKRYEGVFDFTEATETEESKIVILDHAKLLEDGGALDDLLRESLHNPVEEVREAAKRLIREIRVALGTTSMSLSDVNENLSDAPAFDATGLDITTIYGGLRSFFRQIERSNAGVAVVRMTQPSPEAMKFLPEYKDGYAKTIAALADAAAVKEDYTGKFVHYHLTVNSEVEDFERYREAYKAGTLQARLINHFGDAIDGGRAKNLRDVNVQSTGFEEFVNQNADLLSQLGDAQRALNGAESQRMVAWIKETLQEAVLAGVYNLRVNLSAMVNQDVMEAAKQVFADQLGSVSVEEFMADTSPQAQQYRAMINAALSEAQNTALDLTRFVRNNLENGLAVYRQQFETGELQEDLQRAFGRTADVADPKLALSESDIGQINDPSYTFDQLVRQHGDRLVALKGQPADSALALEVLASSPIEPSDIQNAVLQQGVAARASEEGLVAPTTIDFRDLPVLDKALQTQQIEMLRKLADRVRQGELRALQLKDRMVEFIEARIYPKGQVSDYVRPKIDEFANSRRGPEEFSAERSAMKKLFSADLPELVNEKIHDDSEIELKILTDQGIQEFNRLRREVLSAFRQELWDIFNTDAVGQDVDEKVGNAIRNLRLSGTRHEIETRQLERYRDRHGAPDPLPKGQINQDKYRHEGGPVQEAVSARSPHLQVAINSHVAELADPLPVRTRRLEQGKAKNDGGILNEVLDEAARGIANGSLIPDETGDTAIRTGEEQLEATLAAHSGKNEKYRANLRKLLTSGLLWRLKKILRAVNLPVDQSKEHGAIRNNMPNPSMANPFEQAELVRVAELNAHAVPFGTGMNLLNHDFGDKIYYIMKANSSGATQYGPKKLSANGAMHISEMDVKRAAEKGAGAIGWTINPGTTVSKEQRAHMRKVAQWAEKYGLNVIIWSYSRGGDLKKDEETYFDVTLADILIAKDLGATVVKVKLPTDQPAKFRNPAIKAALEARGLKFGSQAEQVELIQRLAGDTPVFFSGGALAGADSVRGTISAISLGGRLMVNRLKGILGSIMGRNAFQRKFRDGFNVFVESWAIFLAGGDEEQDFTIDRRDADERADELARRDFEPLHRVAARQLRNMVRFALSERPDSPLSIVKRALNYDRVKPPPFGARLRPDGTVDDATTGDKITDILRHEIFESSELEKNLEGIMRRSENMAIFPFVENQQVVQDASAYTMTIDQLRQYGDDWVKNERNPRLAMELSLLPRGEGYAFEDYNQPVLWSEIEEAKRIGVEALVVRFDITDLDYNSRMAQLTGVYDKARELGLPVFTVMNPTLDPTMDPAQRVLKKPRSIGVVATALFDAAHEVDTPGFGAIPMPTAEFQDPEDEKQYEARDVALFEREDLGNINSPEGRVKLAGTFGSGLKVKSFMMFGGLDHKMPSHIIQDAAAGLIGRSIGTIITRDAKLTTPELQLIAVMHQMKKDPSITSGNQLVAAARAKLKASSSPLAGEAERASSGVGVNKSESNTGGIDLDSEHLDLNIRRDGNGVPLPVSMQPLETINIDGLVPVIIQMTPVSLPLIFGANVDENGDPVANNDADNSLDSARNEYFDKFHEAT